MSLLPSSPDVSPDGDPRVVGLDSEEADELIAALSSETARRLLAELHEDPAPPGELAERVDTSLQNTQYHLEKLEDAGAIEVVGTAYSEKGREMSVYGPADSPLVIFAGEEERASGLRAAVSRLFGGVLALAAGGAVVQQLFGEQLLAGTDETAEPPEPTPTPAPEEPEEDDPGAFDVEPEPTPEPTPEEVADTPAPAPEEAPDAADGLSAAIEGLFAAGLPPGLAFFLGGFVVLLAVVGTTYLRQRRAHS